MGAVADVDGVGEVEGLGDALDVREVLLVPVVPPAWPVPVFELFLLSAA